MMKTSMAALACVLIQSTADAADSHSYDAQVLAKSSRSWDGSALPHYPRGVPEVSIVRITIPPGAELPLHKHPAINAGYLLSGELTVKTDQHKTLHLKAGEALVEVVNRWHFGKNEGHAPAEIVVFYAGKQNLPLSVTKAESLKSIESAGSER